jgi:hypothetical protein
MLFLIWAPFLVMMSPILPAPSKMQLSIRES